MSLKASLVKIGDDELVDRKRLNVAISRAQCMAIGVANPTLAQTSASNLGQLAKINLFSHLVSYAS